MMLASGMLLQTFFAPTGNEITVIRAMCSVQKVVQTWCTNCAATYVWG